MNQSDLAKNSYLLSGSNARQGYMRWWHSFSGVSTATGQRRTFFIEIFLLNPAFDNEVPILGHHPFYKKKGFKSSYALLTTGAYPSESSDGSVISGTQLKNYYPISQFCTAHDPLYIRLDDIICSETELNGSICVTDSEAATPSLFTNMGEASWNLEMHKAVSCNTGFLSSKPACFFGLMDSYWHAEGIKTFFRGTYTLNGETFNVISDNCYGYTDKHWGRAYNRPWILLTSNHLISENSGQELKHSAIAINGCSPRFGLIPLRKRLMIQLTYMGEDFEYDMLSPGFLSASRMKKKVTNKRHVFMICAQNRKSVLKLSVSFLKSLIMKLKYEQPDKNLPILSVASGSDGEGEMELYRITEEGLQLIDILKVKDVLCIFR